MKANALRLSVAVLLLGLAGCAAPPPGTAGGLTPENFAKVIVGKTTAGEVRALLGAPWRIMKSNFHLGEAWGYRYDGAYYEWRVFWIEYSPDGIVREASDSPDFESGVYRGP